MTSNAYVEDTEYIAQLEDTEYIAYLDVSDGLVEQEEETL